MMGGDDDDVTVSVMMTSVQAGGAVFGRCVTRTGDTDDDGSDDDGW